MDEGTFPRFIVYFYPMCVWPIVDIHDESNSASASGSCQLIMHALPGEELYQSLVNNICDGTSIQTASSAFSSSSTLDNDKLCTAFRHHHDTLCNSSSNVPQCIPNSLLTRLKAAWDIWKPYVKDSHLMRTKLFTRDTREEFASGSEAHAQITKLYSNWMAVVQKAKELLLSTNLSLRTMELAAEVGRMVDVVTKKNGEEDEQVAWEVLKEYLPAARAQPKGKATDHKDVEEMAEVFTEEKVDELMEEMTEETTEEFGVGTRSVHEYMSTEEAGPAQPVQRSSRLRKER